jgi:hypothetical protein
MGVPFVPFVLYCLAECIPTIVVGNSKVMGQQCTLSHVSCVLAMTAHHAHRYQPIMLPQTPQALCPPADASSIKPALLPSCCYRGDTTECTDVPCCCDLL